MGQGLFAKIFTWFWFTVILAGVSLEMAGSYTRKLGGVRDIPLERLLPEAARAAADRLDSGGAPALAGYIAQLQQTQPVMAFFFDERGNEVTRRWTGGGVREAGLLALREPGPHRSGSYGELAALRAPGAVGRLYAMVFVLQRRTIAWYWNSVPYARLTVIILVSGILCFMIARHVTRPLLRLQAAAAGIAEGRLETRVGTDLDRRGDEIGGLAVDFNRMAGRIETLVRGQKELLANVSHELRSPLSRLLVALSLARQSPGEEAPEHLERIGVEARRLDKLIGQLLTLSRLDSAVDGGARGPVDLNTLIHEVAADADFEGRAHNRRVTVTADAECLTNGNEEALRSALENIVRNAVRYTAEGTEVEISLHREAARAVIAVRDHGPGVPEAMLENIFIPFRRADSNSEGSGLGLAIAGRAVAAHSGSIRALNAKGGGLLVEMALPVTGL